MTIWTTGNRIVTLVDGEDVFRAMYAGIQAVDARGFIHMAFWQFKPDLVLDVRTRRNTLGNVLRQKALQGVPIRILIWDFLTRLLRTLMPRSVLSTMDFEPLVTPFVGKALYERLVESTGVTDTEHWVQQINAEIRRRRRGREIQLRVASFPDPGVPPGPGQFGPIPIGSHHQKIVIVERPNNGRSRIITTYVLGTNASNEYQDNHEHRRYYPNHPQRSLRPKPWHDAGAIVEGPAATQVQAEFVRRWNLHFPGAPLPVPAPGRELPGGVRARLVTTSPVAQDIRNAQSAAIRGATRYIYAEDQYFCNYEMLDVILEAYIASERLAASGQARPLMIALLTNGRDEFRIVGVVDSPIEVFRYVNFKNLELAMCRGIRLRSGRTIPRSLGEDWRLQPRSGAGRWLLDELCIEREGGERIRLNEIESILGGTRPAFLWSKDAQRTVYIHSKLTIIDDRQLFIGSANYSTRSMEYDSEASLQIDAGATAVDLRGRLFDEVLGPPPANVPYRTAEEQIRFWQQRAHSNARRGRSCCHPAGRNVCLIEYPDRRPDMMRLAQHFSTLTQAPLYVAPLVAPLSPLLQQLRGRATLAVLARLLEFIYPFY